MAVYTPVTIEDLGPFLRHYSIGSAKSLEPFPDGVENTNYRLITTQGGFVLTLFEKRVRAEDLPFCLGFMEHLHARGIPCPTVMPDNIGNIVTTLKNKPAAVTTFLFGRWPRRIELVYAEAVGALLGQMHTEQREFKMKRDNPMSLRVWHGLIDACGNKPDTLERGMVAILHREMAWLSQNWPKDLPQGTVHADLFPDNVFFEGQKISGVIDFYFSCTETFVYDLMLTVNAWCFDPGGTINRERAAALTNAYKQNRHMSSAERAAQLFFGRAAALRILSTRLYDWFHPAEDAQVTPKDPLEYFRILRFYQKEMGTP